MFTKILVATDGSDHANHALKYATESAVKWDAKLIILSVIPPIRPIIPDPDELFLTHTSEFDNRLESSYKKILDEAVNTAVKSHPDIKFEARLKKGHPANVIVDVAKSEGVDLIVMGSRGLGGITGSILGSTSQAVVHSCTCPILIIK